MRSLPLRKGRFGADGFLHSVGHRAVPERAEKMTSAVHGKVPRRPDGLLADIAGEDRLVASEFVHRARSAEDATGGRLEHDVARDRNDADAALQDRPADGDLE